MEIVTSGFPRSTPGCYSWHLKRNIEFLGLFVEYLAAKEVLNAVYENFIKLV